MNAYSNYTLSINYETINNVCRRTMARSICQLQDNYYIYLFIETYS